MARPGSWRYFLAATVNALSGPTARPNSTAAVDDFAAGARMVGSEGSIHRSAAISIASSVSRWLSSVPFTPSSSRPSRPGVPPTRPVYIITVGASSADASARPATVWIAMSGPRPARRLACQRTGPRLQARAVARSDPLNSSRLFGDRPAFIEPCRSRPPATRTLIEEDRVSWICSLRQMMNRVDAHGTRATQCPTAGR